MTLEYKIAELGNPGWSGKIDAKEVEKLINEIADLGWEFVSLTVQSGVGISNTVMAVFKRPSAKSSSTGT
jgi:hypothetical protein